MRWYWCETAEPDEVFIDAYGNESTEREACMTCEGTGSDGYGETCCTCGGMGWVCV